MKFAIVKFGKSQYKIKEGDKLLIDRIVGVKEGEQKEVEGVLLVVDGESVIFGKPYIKGAKVNIKVLGEKKGEKIQAATYKAKARQRKKVGLRPIFTQILIEKIIQESISNLQKGKKATSSKK